MLQPGWSWPPSNAMPPGISWVIPPSTAILPPLASPPAWSFAPSASLPGPIASPPFPPLPLVRQQHHRLTLSRHCRHCLLLQRSLHWPDYQHRETSISAIRSAKSVFTISITSVSTIGQDKMITIGLDKQPDLYKEIKLLAKCMKCIKMDNATATRGQMECLIYEYQCNYFYCWQKAI